MKRKIVTTSDGSKTIQIEDWNEQYHSIHGAINEANHVFIDKGLFFFCSENKTLTNKISILEIGFGTGLNAFLTLIEAEKLNLHIDYVGIEAYPISLKELKALNYVSLISKLHQKEFLELHQSHWGETVLILASFQFKKEQKLFQELSYQNEFDIIYFDAFGARVQPELWTELQFKIMYNALKVNGVLVTYSAKGSVRRAMQSLGFNVEKLPGPPGKREMLRATKR